MNQLFATSPQKKFKTKNPELSTILNDVENLTQNLKPPTKSIFTNSLH